MALEHFQFKFIDIKDVQITFFNFNLGTGKRLRLSTPGKILDVTDQSQSIP